MTGEFIDIKDWIIDDWQRGIFKVYRSTMTLMDLFQREHRIHGPRLISEFATQGNVGGDKSHIHSIYRDPDNEYGRASSLS